MIPSMARFPTPFVPLPPLSLFLSVSLLDRTLELIYRPTSILF
jgi:hypothetical protein